MTKIETRQPPFCFYKITSVLAYLYPNNSGVLREWIEADVKPAPDTTLAQDFIGFLGDEWEVEPGKNMPGHYGRKAAVNAVLAISNGRTVVLEEGFNAREFWANLYAEWYNSLTSDQLQRPINFDLAGRLFAGDVDEIGRIAKHNRWMDGAQAFLDSHGFDLDLLPDITPQSGETSHEVWALIKHKAIQVGGRDLWQTIVAAADRSVRTEG